jgi:hypothetical protein
MQRLRIGFYAVADFEAVHARHHDIEQHDIRRVVLHDLEGGGAAVGGDDVEIFGGQLRFQKPDVRRNIINDQDPR